MNRRITLLYTAAVAASLSLWMLDGRAVDITITNLAAPGTPCVLHMGTHPDHALQADPDSGGQPGDLKVAGTFSAGDPCVSGSGLPAPSGSVSLAEGAVPVGGVPFGVNWQAQNATSCTFQGTGWSGVACSSLQDCTAGGTQQVIRDQGTWDFILSCTNGTGPEMEVARETIEVGPPPTETCGYGVGTRTRQLTGKVGFPTSTITYMSQPLLEWGALFSITPQCAPTADSCMVWDPFPHIENARYYLTTRTDQYVSLRFTTAGLDPQDQGGAVLNVQNPGATENTRVEYSISNRCGDFDRTGSPWLAANPACVQDLTQKTAFYWTTAPSPYTCSLRTNGQIDPNQVWYLNMRVTRCNGQEGGAMPSLCTLYLHNKD